MNAHERAVEALEQEVHSEDGWLSDAQEANLRVSYDGTVEFCGEGSIDLKHLVSLVIDVIQEESEDEMYQAKCGSWDCRAPECGRM